MSDARRDPDDDAPTGEIAIGRGAGGSATAPAEGDATAPAEGDATAAGTSPGDPSGPSPGDPNGPNPGDPNGPNPGDPNGSSSGDPSGPNPGDASGSSSGDAATTGGGRPGARRRLLSFGPLPGDPGDPRQRRRRRWFVTGIAVAAGIVVVALCAGALSVVSTVNGVRDRAADARAAHALRENDCLDLEKRLNRLVPPGSTTGPGPRATAIRDENAAVRIYVDQLDTQRDEDAWRQLLDARTVFADALDRQAKSRTPAFFVAPRTDNGLAVADQLVQWSPAQCAGPIRRLAAPEL